ncbi:hypothetical protein K402DRAFT_334406 [Aulographum hederae CBS 113979]|uniref:CCD97-like C-terminal domain-containing protein n=1 Tax=Aulographum hederae CBS 113979 TaxID=1176131 RepID=A0A6G1GWY6_9PEZI|nr:hypothetical protein K402DRAFT_334406 [Aulographum hederae CBS 113979]
MTVVLRDTFPVADNSANHRRIVIKNRRKRYLDTHPEYFSSELELADPLLYDRLVRHFQTSAERTAEDRAKGWSGIVEADIERSEAKLQALANPDPNATVTYRLGEDGEIVEEDADEDMDGNPQTKEQALEEWKSVMTLRFLAGDDDDFEYETVDEDERLDFCPEAERDMEEAYFDAQEPVQVREDGEPLTGETGVQDF